MRSLFLGTALLVASSVGAFAQTSPAQTPEASAPVPAAPATLANDLRPTFVAQNPSDRVTSKLVGLTIQNGANETIGEIADVVLDDKNTVKSWVVGVGGFLGLGTKYVAIDPSALTITRVNDTTLKAVIDTNKDQLRAAPEYIYLGKAKPDAKATDAKATDAKATDAKTTDTKTTETKTDTTPTETSKAP